MDRSRFDIRLLFTTRVIRLFAYGFLSVVLVFYLAQLGMNEKLIGVLLTLTLAGDAAITLWLTTSADKTGRRRMLFVGAGLMILAGLVFAVTRNPVILIIAAIIGVISPSGNEIGPFLAIEQAALSQLLTARKRTRVLAWYNLAGSFSTALGALAGGWLSEALRGAGYTALNSYRMIIICYALAGAALACCFLFLSPKVEVAAQVARPVSSRFGLHKSKKVVFELSALFSLDAFAGGFIIQSIIAYWFFVKFHVDTGVIGTVFFAANILAGISALLAASIAKRFGLINTMVFTHIPSNILLILVPLMPTFWLAMIVLLLRFSISQMDVPARQSYTMGVVDPDERSAANGITAIARSVGAAISPSLSGLFIAIPALISMPFFICGGLKIVYDLTLYRRFRARQGVN